MSNEDKTSVTVTDMAEFLKGYIDKKTQEQIEKVKRLYPDEVKKEKGNK